MTSIIFNKQRLMVLIACAVIWTACAEERDPVNRVQPYALDKAYFIGEDFEDTRDDPEFYSRNHVVDVGYGADGAATAALFTSTFAEPVGRIKWQITEDYLIGRLSYERIQDSDGKGVPVKDINGNAVGASTNDGIVAAMFAIESHFDIVNEYNPTTGEKLNVIEENDEDRPWYERQYMRVDWSQNLNTDSYDFDTLSLIGIYGSVEYEPLSFFVEDPNDDQAPHFDLENGYFDVTTKAFAKPLTIDLSQYGWGIDSMPACFLPYEFTGGSYPSGSCNPVEITLRHSFVRIDKNGDGLDDSDYEPRDYDGIRFAAYGGFYNERFGYARNYGMTDAQWHRMLNRYNIWERSHYFKDPKNMSGPILCDSNDDTDNDGTADACDEVTEALYDGEEENRDANLWQSEGSQCDLFKGMCTLPYRYRTPKPIPFYYTDTSNPKYFEPSELAVHEWDVSLRSAVQTARYAECMRTVNSSVSLPSDWDSWAEDQPSGEADLADISELKAAYVEGRSSGEEICHQKYPVWSGQMDDQEDAVGLALDVDDCRNGRAYVSADKEHPTNCMKVLGDLADMRTIATDTDEVKNGVRAAAEMDEMLVLCHSPVLFDDPKICGENRLPKDVNEDLCIAAKNLDDDEPTQDMQSVIDDSEVDGIDSLTDLVAACKEALRIRHGDLRYHVLNVIDRPQELSPWGIMVSSIDPVTGENIATNCNIWSHVTDLATQKIVDQMRLIKGELTFEDVTEATNVADWVQAAESAARDGALGTVSREQLSTRISNFLSNKSDPKFLDNLEAGFVNGNKISDSDREAATKVFDELKDIRADSTVANTDARVIASRRKSAQDTTFEASLMTEAMMQKSGVNGLTLSDSVIDAASPLRGANPSMHRDLKRMMDNALHKRNMCILEADMADETPVALAPLADLMEEKFGKFDANDPLDVQLERAEKMRQYIAAKMHYSVIAHEIGHSVAHRHNFVGSSDAWSYRPQYWQLRTKDGAVSRECDGTEADGENCVGPRYIDPVTDAERDNLIYMFMTSSVMDYPGDITQDFMPPGIWDFAATRMFYGDVVSVIDDPEFYAAADGQEDTPTMLLSKPYGAAYKNDASFGGLLGIQYSNGETPIHYSQSQNVFGMIDPGTCAPISDANLKAFKPGRYDSDSSGEWHPLLDGRMVAPNGDGQYTRCRQPKVDYVQWSTLNTPPYPSSFYENDNNAYYWKDSRYWDDKDRVIEPYTFASDSWADIGNVSVYRHDNGADLYEIFNFLITEKEMSYIFDKYRRGRSDFSIKAAADRGLYRYDEKIKEGAKGLAFLKNIISQKAVSGVWDEESGSFVTYNPEDYFYKIIADWYGGHIETNILASTYAFDFFARELARPESGYHGYAAVEDDEDNILRSVWDGGNFSFEYVYVDIPNGPTSYWGMMSPGGQLLENSMAEDQGEFDRDYILNCGSYYDKANVAMLLTESVDNFISSSRTDFYDPRFRSASLADLLPDGYRRLIANALTNDEYIKGPRLAADATGNLLVDADWFPAEAIGWTSWWGETPVSCFPVDGKNTCGDFASDNFETLVPEYTVPVDSQIGWEQQKFLIAWTLLYLPENQMQDWVNQLHVYDLGVDADPTFTNRIELHHPEAPVYVARTYGREDIFGRTVQKGIAARVLEYADGLLAKSYETTVVDIDNDGVVDWHEPVLNANGLPIVLYDSRIDYPASPDTCNTVDNSGCTCEDNRTCVLLKDYLSVPAYLRQAIEAYGMADASF
jgi:hypothetical protein